MTTKDLQYVVRWQRTQQLHVAREAPMRCSISWELNNAATGQQTLFALAAGARESGMAATPRHLRAVQVACGQIAGTRVDLKTTGAVPDDSMHGTLHGAHCIAQAAAAHALLRVAAGEASALLWTATDHDNADCWHLRLHANAGDQYGVALRGKVACMPILLRCRHRGAAGSPYTGQLVHSATISGGLGGRSRLHACSS